MPTMADLAYTKQYDDLTKLSEAQLDAAYESIQDYVNTLKDNFLSVTLDALGSDYTYPGTGAAVYTNTLYAKQNGTDSYNGGDISIGTTADAAYAAVDAVNASISFTPERAGRYRAVFFFNHVFQLNNTSEGRCETSFRFTDGVDASFAVRSGGYFPAPAANAIRMSNPIMLTHIFNWTDTTAKVVTLQKFVRLATNINTNQVAATAATGEIYMLVEKI